MGAALPWEFLPKTQELRPLRQLPVGSASWFQAPRICELHLETLLPTRKLRPSAVWGWPRAHSPPTSQSLSNNMAHTTWPLRAQHLLAAAGPREPGPQEGTRGLLTLALPRKSTGSRCSRCRLWGRKTSPLGTCRGCSGACFWRRSGQRRPEHPTRAVAAGTLRPLLTGPGKSFPMPPHLRTRATSL